VDRFYYGLQASGPHTAAKYSG